MPNILTVNGGSSSIRIAVYGSGAPPQLLLDGKVERLGTQEPLFHVSRTGEPKQSIKLATSAGRSPIEPLMDWLEGFAPELRPEVIGHRVVHGMLHSAPERVTPQLIAELKRFVPYDPEHMPREIEFIEALQSRYSDVPQVVCFDTAFHRTMPRVATQLPIPRKYAADGVQRYGFHGLSYTYLVGELLRLGEPSAASGRVILAHLGSGASLAAVLNGRSIDTSMGFTPASGLVMGTRSGDLDPGVMSYLAKEGGMDTARLQLMVNHESGLLGVSETSADVRDLLQREDTDERAREALALFAYQARKWIGAFAAALGGIDTLVFAGGVGENSAVIRERICVQLQFLGVQLDSARNACHAARISSDGSAVGVRVIKTDEERVIADLTWRELCRRQ